MKVTNKIHIRIQVNSFFLVSSTCFWRCFRPSSGAFDCIYSIWLYSPRLQPAATWVSTTRYCKYSQMLLMMGENIARNM
jgi:hypothetical protein